MAIVISKLQDPELFEKLQKRGLLSHPASSDLNYMYIHDLGLPMNALWDKVEKLIIRVKKLEEQKELRNSGLSSALNNPNFVINDGFCKVCLSTGILVNHNNTPCPNMEVK